MSKRKTVQMTQLTMLLAMGIVLNYLEPQLPVAVPGAKLGLANIIGVIALVLFGPKQMIAVNIMRVLIASLLRGTLFATAFWLSLTGVLLSTAVVIICYKLWKPSVVMLSVLSSIFHCVGQVIAVSIIYNSWGMLFTLPQLLVFAIPTGIVTGILAQEALKRIWRR